MNEKIRNLVNNTIAQLRFLNVSTEEINDNNLLIKFNDNISLNIINRILPITKCTTICDCSICIERIYINNDIRILKCNHSFHQVCIDKWILEEHRPTCPVCRYHIAIQFQQSDGSSVNINS